MVEVVTVVGREDGVPYWSWREKVVGVRVRSERLQRLRLRRGWTWICCASLCSVERGALDLSGWLMG